MLLVSQGVGGTGEISKFCFQEFSSTNGNAVEKAWWLTILGMPLFFCLIQEKSYSQGDPRIFPSICGESTG